MASTRRTTGMPCQPPRGTAPRAWLRFLPSLLPPCHQAPRLTLPVLQPQPSPKLQSRLPALWSHARASVLLRWAPHPPPRMAPLARLPASAVTPTVKGTAARMACTTRSRTTGTRVRTRTAARSTAPARPPPLTRRRASTVTAATVNSSGMAGLQLHQQVEITQK